MDEEEGVSRLSCMHHKKKSVGRFVCPRSSHSPHPLEPLISDLVTSCYEPCAATDTQRVPHNTSPHQLPTTSPAPSTPHRSISSICAAAVARACASRSARVSMNFLNDPGYVCSLRPRTWCMRQHT